MKNNQVGIGHRQVQNQINISQVGSKHLQVRYQIVNNTVKEDCDIRANDHLRCKLRYWGSWLSPLPQQQNK